MTAATSGQDLIDSMRIRLGSLSNAFTTDQYLSFINEGVSEIWSVIKSLDLDYFTNSSEDTDATQDNAFLDLSTAKREYALPAECRELRALECLTVGFEDRVFEYRQFNDPIFQEARRESTASGSATATSFSGTRNRYYYTIFGTQFILAQYPESALNLKLWYIKAINDVSVADFPEILRPFDKKIVDFSTQRATLAMQNTELSLGWMTAWKEDIKTLAMSVGLRSTSNAIFVSDYLGG